MSNIQRAVRPAERERPPVLVLLVVGLAVVILSAVMPAIPGLGD